MVPKLGRHSYESNGPAVLNKMTHGSLKQSVDSTTAKKTTKYTEAYLSLCFTTVCNENGPLCRIMLCLFSTSTCWTWFQLFYIKTEDHLNIDIDIVLVTRLETPMTLFARDTKQTSSSLRILSSAISNTTTSATLKKKKVPPNRHYHLMENHKNIVE